MEWVGEYEYEYEWRIVQLRETDIDRVREK